jgi:multiple sugar transport system permease protein
VAISATLISLAASLLAAYAIQRLKFKTSGPTGVAIFLGYLVPQTILFIPLAHIIFQIRLWDSLWSLVLTYPTFLIPFCTWLLMGYFKSIPKEMEECAMIDGAGRIRIFWKIILPLCLPGILSAAIFCFTLSWNEYIYALAFISSTGTKTVPIGLVTELVRGDVYHWGALMAGALCASVPVALVYSLFVEHYVAGMTGALKE